MSPAVNGLNIFMKDSILRALGLCRMETLSTGDCPVLPVVQALDNVNVSHRELAQLRAAFCVRRQVKYTVQMHITDHVYHEVRMKTPVNVQLGGMNKPIHGSPNNSNYIWRNMLLGN